MPSACVTCPANSHLDPLMTLEVIPAADHFQIDVEVIVSLPASGQWLHGCGGQRWQRVGFAIAHF